MKIRKTKKGFTIVELVIVIAVIGILAAILIPTFVGLNNRANDASDNALVNNLNKALKMEEGNAGHEKSTSMQGAINDLKAQGYLLSQLSTKSGKVLVWNQEDNQFVLNPTNEQTGAKYWKIANSVSEFNENKMSYSIYVGDDWKPTSVSDFKYGFDAGERKGIETVSYDANVGDETIVIRTNGGRLNVNAPSTEMQHYGNLDTLQITAIKNGSYRENGSIVNAASLTAGRIIVEDGGYIKSVALAATATKETASVIVDGYVGLVDSSAIAAEADKVIATGNGYVIHNGSEEAAPMGDSEAVTTAIDSVADLHRFRDKVNEGYPYAGLTVNLNADIDLTGAVWAPIGNVAFPFTGTFNGRGHKITGLTNDGYIMTDIQKTEWSGNLGGSYGFFGVIGGNANTTIKNLILDDIDINIDQAKTLGGLFANDVNKGLGNIEIDGITVSGKLLSDNPTGVTLGGIGGKVYNKGKTTIKNCINKAKLVVKNVNNDGDIKIAGIIGFVSGFEYNPLKIEKCKNYGDIEAKSTCSSRSIYAAGIVVKTSQLEESVVSPLVAFIKDCSTQGNVNLEITGNSSIVYYSVIARGANAENEKEEQDLYPEYDYYNNNYPATALYAKGNSITSESGYNAFKAVIKEQSSSRTIDANYQGLDYFKLYNNSVNNA